jgi:hypothetical protein
MINVKQNVCNTIGVSGFLGAGYGIQYLYNSLLVLPYLTIHPVCSADIWRIVNRKEEVIGGGLGL